VASDERKVFTITHRSAFIASNPDKDLPRDSLPKDLVELREKSQQFEVRLEEVHDKFVVATKERADLQERLSNAKEWLSNMTRLKKWNDDKIAAAQKAFEGCVSQYNATVLTAEKALAQADQLQVVFDVNSPEAKVWEVDEETEEELDGQAASESTVAPTDTPVPTPEVLGEAASESTVAPTNEPTTTPEVVEDVNEEAVIESTVAPTDEPTPTPEVVEDVEEEPVSESTVAPTGRPVNAKGVWGSDWGSEVAAKSDVKYVKRNGKWVSEG